MTAEPSPLGPLSLVSIRGGLSIALVACLIMGAGVQSLPTGGNASGGSGIAPVQESGPASPHPGPATPVTLMRLSGPSIMPLVATTGPTPSSGAIFSATFGVSPRSGTVPFYVNFSGQAQTGPNDTHLYLSWAYGDGSSVWRNISVLRNHSYALPVLTHQYASSGTFIANASLGNGTTILTSSFTITALAPVHAKAVATPSVVTLGQPVSVDASATGGASPYTFHWGYLPLGCSVDANTPSHVDCLPPTAGKFQAAVQVSDSGSNHLNVTASFTVNQTMVITFASPTQFVCNGTVGYVAVNFTSSVHGGTPPYSYAWDPGDGTGAVPSQNLSYDYRTAGTYLASITVTDASGSVASRNVSVTTAFGSCGQVGSSGSAVPPLVIAGVLLLVVIIVLLLVLITRLPPARPPARPRGTSRSSPSSRSSPGTYDPPGSP